MKLLNDWISEEMLKVLGWTLVHTLWQMVLVAGILWIALRLLKRSSPALKYGLAVGALLVSFLLTLGTFVYEWSLAAPNQGFTIEKAQIFLLESSAAIQEITLENRMAQVMFWIDQNLSILVNFWFFGSLLFLFRFVNSLSEIRNLRKSAALIQDFELEKTTYRLMGKLGINRSVELRSSIESQSPLTFGTIKPVILLPAALIFHLNPAQLEAIIAHELAHVKRNDYLSNLLLSGLEVVFFFHPCYWWMSQTVKELRENAADDLAIKAGIEPKVLATGLAEVLNFAKQNSPELALAAGKKRNPTLLRIKRMLGYHTENYPQTPIISIPMILTLFLSAGLMASAQQDAPKTEFPIEANPVTDASPLAVAFEPVLDTLPPIQTTVWNTKEHRISFSTDEGVHYVILGDKLISGNDTLTLSPKLKAELEKLYEMEGVAMPELILPEMPEFQEEWIVPVPDYDLEIPLPPDPIEPPFVDFDFENLPSWNFNFGDTSKMTPAEREQMRKEMELNWSKWSENAAKNAKEWEAKWKANEGEWKQRMVEWEAKFKAEFEPKMKEFELKMKEWQTQNEPKMQEFEAKMKEWQAAQEPKLKEWEAKIKEWEIAQKPKMEEFHRKMEIWQKEHQMKMQEFQKLVQEEFKKENK